MSATKAKREAYHHEGTGEHKDTAVLVIHGFTGSPQTMYPLVEALHAKGYTVDAPMLTGHGTTPEDMEKSTAIDWKNDVIKAANTLRQAHKRVIAAGLSMGGCLSLILAEQGLVDGVISINAPIKIFKSADAFFAGVVWPFYRFDKNVAKSMEGAYGQYQVEYEKTPVRCVPQLNRIIRETRNNLSLIKCPALVIQTQKDDVVRPISGQLIYDGITSHKEMVSLEHSTHVSTLHDTDSEIIHERAIAFINAIAS